MISSVVSVSIAEGLSFELTTMECKIERRWKHQINVFARLEHV